MAGSPAALGDSYAVEIGQEAVPIGYGFSRDDPVFARGVVTLTDCRYLLDPVTTVAALIESNAALSMDVIGRPMVNGMGEVIGIHIGNARDHMGGKTVGINDAREIAAQLIERGYVERSSLGIVFLDVTESLAEALGLVASTGIIVVDVSPGAGAELAGLNDYDVIVRFDDTQNVNSWDLGRFLMAHPSGATVIVIYCRDGVVRSTQLVLGERTAQSC